MSTIAAFPSREVTPPNYVQRVNQPGPLFKQVEPKAKFLADFSKFQTGSSEFELEATKYLYENQDAGEHEYRVHCHWLGTLIADGQALIIEALLNGVQGIETEKQFVQQKVGSYIATLHEWHGAPGTHNDEASTTFHKAMLEADSDQVEPCNL